MNITIQINDEEFSKSVSEGLKEIPNETRDKIVIEAMKEYLKNSKHIENIFFYTSYGSTKPTELLKSIINRSLPQEEITELAKEIINTVRMSKEDFIIAALKAAIVEELCNNKFRASLFDSLMKIESRIDAECVKKEGNY